MDKDKLTWLQTFLFSVESTPTYLSQPQQSQVCWLATQVQILAQFQVVLLHIPTTSVKIKDIIHGPTLE